MICDNCGKSNATGIETCAYCGSEMPKVSECAGFGDILTYSVPDSISVANPGINDDSGRISDADMKNLLKKSDSIIRGTKFNMLLVAICAFMLLISIVISVFTIIKINNLEANLNLDPQPVVDVPVAEEPEEEPYESKYSDTNYETEKSDGEKIQEIIVAE